AVPGLVGHRCAERRKGRVGEIINYGSANTQIPPPLGGSGILPGNSRPNPPFIPATSPAHPDSTARYCLPSTVNVLGGATIPELVSASHNSLPVAASKAWTFLSLVPPVNTRPPAVVSIEPHVGLVAYMCVHTRMPVSTFQACTSPPTCFAPGTIRGGPPKRTPANDLPAEYSIGKPTSAPHRLLLAGM